MWLIAYMWLVFFGLITVFLDSLKNNSKNVQTGVGVRGVEEDLK